MISDERLLKALGENIRRARVEKKLTQEKLAEAAGMDITNLQRIEAGKYNTKVLTLIRLQVALEEEWDLLIPKP